MTMILTSLLAIIGLTNAYAVELVEPRDIYLDYKHYNQSARNPLILNGPERDALELHLNSNLAHYFFWDNTVHGTTDSGGYRLIGLIMELGVRIHPNIELEYYHHSQHLLDSVYPYSKFPVEDAFQVNIYFYRVSKEPSVFK